MFDSVRLVPLFSTFPLVGGVTAALLLLRTLESLAQCRTLPDSILGAFIKLVVRRLTGEEISVQTE